MQAKEWEKLIEVMGKPKWAENPRYHDRLAMGTDYPDECDALLEPWLKERTKQDLFSLFQDNALPFCPVDDVKEVLESSQLRERQFFVKIEHPQAGARTRPGVVWKLLSLTLPPLATISPTASASRSYLSAGLVNDLNWIGLDDLAQSAVCCTASATRSASCSWMSAGCLMVSLCWTLSPLCCTTWVTSWASSF